MKLCNWNESSRNNKQIGGRICVSLCSVLFTAAVLLFSWCKESKVDQVGLQVDFEAFIVD